jgi:hypothetical protein
MHGGGWRYPLVRASVELRLALEDGALDNREPGIGLAIAGQGPDAADTQLKNLAGTGAPTR